MRDLYPDQIEYDTPESLIEAIQGCSDIARLNKMRSSCVKHMRTRPEILEMWQKKYMDAKYNRALNDLNKDFGRD